MHLIIKNLPPFNVSDNNMMQCAGCVYTGFTWHLLWV